jgi:hypothetical protein
MAWKKLLLTGCILAVAMIGSKPASAESSGCGVVEALGGGCSTGTSMGDHVDVGVSTGGASWTSGGDGADGGPATTGSSGSTGSPDASNGPSSTTGTPGKACPPGGGRCLDAPTYSATAPGAPGAPGVPAAPVVVTMAQVASFSPIAPTVVSEPGGWGMVGMHTNFVVRAPVSTASGTLLGRSAQVRFTPVSFSWDYGDGGTATTSTGGDTWPGLGVPDFSPTPTSHVYAARGGYTASATVTYTAVYSIGGGAWQPVIGTLTLSAGDAPVTIVQAKTVLVQDTCAANPAGPGC